MLNQSKKILVTGATGFIGRHLTQALLEKNYNVRVFVRNEEKARKMFGDKVEYAVGDFEDENKLVKALQHIDIVFHLVGKQGFTTFGSDYKEFHKINVLYTQSIAKISAFVGVKKFIFLSSAAVFGDSLLNINVDETFICKPDTHYQKTKLEAEKTLFKISKDNLTFNYIIGDIFLNTTE